MSKLITYNTGNAAKYVQNARDAMFNAEFQAIQINNLNPDYLLLQEISEGNFANKYVNQEKIIAKKLNIPFAYYKTHSKLPLLNSGVMSVTKKIEPISFEAISNPNTLLPGLSNRWFMVTREILEEDKELVILNIHLVAFGIFEAVRLKQLKYILKFVEKEKEKGNIIIVAGDFNQELDNSNEFSNAITDCKMAIQDLDYQTHNSGKYYDWILTSEEVEVENVESTKDFKYSDHCPVQMEFKLK